MTIILETKRLILLHQVIEDLNDLWVLYCNPNITKHFPFYVYPVKKQVTIEG